MKAIIILLKRILHKLGFYRKQRYYCYSKSPNSNKFKQHGSKGKPFIYGFSLMLYLKETMESQGFEFRAEKIESKAMFKNKKDGKTGNWLPNKTKGVEITNINEAINGKQFPVSRNAAIK